MKTDRTAMHRRAQRAEAERDAARSESAEWKGRWLYITGQRREERLRWIGDEIEKYRHRVSVRIGQAAAMVAAFLIFGALTS